MNTTPIRIERTYNASPARVWQALTDKSQMKEWYFDLDEFRPEPGFEFSFYGQGHKGEQYLHRCKVLEAVPLQKLSYSWTYEGYEGYSVVTFRLFEENGGTRLFLTHEGLETFPANNPDFAAQSFSDGWTYITGAALKEYLEKKK